MRTPWFWTPRVMEAIDDAIARGVMVTEIAAAIGIARNVLRERRMDKRLWSVADEMAAIEKIDAMQSRPKKLGGWFGESDRHRECKRRNEETGEMKSETEELPGRRKEFREIVKWDKLQDREGINISFEDADTNDGGFIRLHRPDQIYRSPMGGTLR